MSYLKITKDSENDNYIIDILVVGVIHIKARALKQKTNFYELTCWQFKVSEEIRKSLYRR